MEKLIDWAYFYHALGFNVTHIIPEKNKQKRYPYKAPTNDRQNLINRRQLINEVRSYDWENATGIGVILGRNNIRAIDIDHSTLLKNNPEIKLSDLSSMIRSILSQLDLPDDYRWVVQTPSSGYHIIFKCENLPYEVEVNPVSPYGEKKTKGFVPNRKTKKSYPSFGHFDMRWHLHLTLPPSSDHLNKVYRFINGNPTKEPLSVCLEKVEEVIFKYCYDEDKIHKIRGYNLNVGTYYAEHFYTDFKSIIKN